MAKPCLYHSYGSLAQEPTCPRCSASPEGEKARVRSGPLAGMQGIVLRHSRRTRIVLSLDLILQSIAVEVDVADLEPIESHLSNLA